jgi:hypothetical protein
MRSVSARVAHYSEHASARVVMKGGGPTRWIPSPVRNLLREETLRVFAPPNYAT